MSWHEITETCELMEDEEPENEDDDDIQFIKDFNHSLQSDCGNEVHEASIKNAVDGVRRIAKVCNAPTAHNPSCRCKIALHSQGPH